MAGEILKRRLSASTDGRFITVTGTAATGTLIHTSISGTSASGTYDEVWVWAHNTATIDRLLTLEWARSTGQAGQAFRFTVPTRDGGYLIIPGWPLQNSRQVRAFAAAASVITIGGYVHRIS